MVDDPDIQMATLKKRIVDPHEITDPNVVKVVTDLAGDAIYFSRPADSRTAVTAAPRTALLQTHRAVHLPARFPARLSALPVGPLEQAERLEQLRALENGYRIRVVETDYESLGVDTPEDLERVCKRFVRSTSLAGMWRYRNG